MNKIVAFFKDSYKTSPIAFFCELIEAALLITASAVLSFTILDPATKIFVPMYLIGSIMGIVSAIYRKAAFVIVLCSWFTAMNLFAMVQLFL